MSPDRTWDAMTIQQRAGMFERERTTGFGGLTGFHYSDTFADLPSDVQACVAGRLDISRAAAATGEPLTERVERQIVRDRYLLERQDALRKTADLVTVAQADGIHSDEPGQADQIGGCSCGARFYSFEAADDHADECPLPDERDLPADTIASHLRNLQQLIELRTERPLDGGISGLDCGGYSSTALFVGVELDAVNARIAKALALAEQMAALVREHADDLRELSVVRSTPIRFSDKERARFASFYAQLAEQVTT